MNIIASKPTKRHTLIDPIFVLLFSALALLLFFALFPGNVSDLAENMLGSLSNTSTTVSINTTSSFADDQQYWETYCGPGWSKNAGCDAIVIRAELCTSGVESAYCSQYENYVEQYRNK